MELTAFQPESSTLIGSLVPGALSIAQRHDSVSTLGGVALASVAVSQPVYSILGGGTASMPQLVDIDRQAVAPKEPLNTTAAGNPVQASSFSSPAPLIRLTPNQPRAKAPTIFKKKSTLSASSLGLTVRPKLPQSQSRTVSVIGASAQAQSRLTSSVSIVPTKRPPAPLVVAPKTARTSVLNVHDSTLLSQRAMSQPTPQQLPLLQEPASHSRPDAPQSLSQSVGGTSIRVPPRLVIRGVRPSPEEVAKYAHAQVPALNKMKQTLEAMTVSFARISNDALLIAWDPEFE